MASYSPLSSTKLFRSNSTFEAVASVVADERFRPTSSTYQTTYRRGSPPGA